MSSRLEPAPRPAHILIVEDSALVSGALRVLFDASGYRVSVAASVGEATELAGDPPDAVLLDLTLPDGDGADVIGPLKSAGTKLFIALTGRDDPAAAERVRRAGCADILIKPVLPRELLARVSQLLKESDALASPG